MGKLAFTVLRGPLLIDGEGPYTDEVEIEDADEDFVRKVSHAHAAGIVDVTEGLDLSTVQSQEDGEAAQEAAQADGSWQEGNVLQHYLGKAQVALARAQQAIADAAEEEREPTEEELAAVEDAKKLLADVEVDIQNHMGGEGE